MKTHQQISAILMLAGISAIVALHFILNTSPSVIAADAAEEEFSAERAAWHLPALASEKNFIGTEANLRVRDYILEELGFLGLQAELHTTEYYDAPRQRAATVSNIIARMPGTESTKTILFMGHYDTVADAYGASDNGSAVITLLELIRLLRHHPPLKNDLIFLFPDGEEVGLLGAQAFLKDHPLAAEIDLVINFEARGTTGQSIMFETGENNNHIIKEFAAAAPYPIGNSLSVEIYKRMPNATDFTVFKESGYQGLNFAYLGNPFDYHTAGDNIENTDLQSIQHHGSYAKALALHFGNNDMQFQAQEDAVYFNTFRYGFVSYPYSRVLAISLLVFLLSSLVLMLGFHQKNLSFTGIIKSFLALLLKLLTIYFITDALFIIIGKYYPGGSFLLLEYNHNTILAGFALSIVAFAMIYILMIQKGINLWKLLAMVLLLTVLFIWSGQINIWRILIIVVASTWLFIAHRKPTQLSDLIAGGMIIWILLMGVLTFTVKGASYLFTWPLLLSLFPFALMIYRKPLVEPGVRHTMIWLIFSIPLLVWFSTLVHLFHTAMGLNALPIAMLLAGLVACLLVPHFYIMGRLKPFLIPAITLLSGIVILLSAVTGLDYNERHRKPVNIVSAHLANDNESLWISNDEKPYGLARHYLGEEPEEIPFSRIFPLSTRSVLSNKTHVPDPKIEVPVVEVFADSIYDGERIIKLNIRSQREAARIAMYFNTESADTHIRFEGGDRHKLNTSGNTQWRLLNYYAPPEEGITFTLYCEMGTNIQLHLTEHSYSLPYDTLRPAPYTMPRGEQTVVVKLLDF